MANYNQQEQEQESASLSQQRRFEQSTAHTTLRSEVESDAIKKALVGLSPNTRQSLLTLLLAAQPNGQQHQQQHHPHPQQQPQPQPQHQHQHQQQIQLDLDQQIQSPSHVNYHSTGSWNDLNFLPSLLCNQPLHSELPSPILPDQLSKHPFHSNRTESIPSQITPALSPSMTPLSTFSTSSYPNSAAVQDVISSHNSVHPPFHQPSNHQLEFFSPLTSPALRPLGYHDSAQMSRPDINNPIPSNFHQTVTTHNMPALIDQAAALGLSAHQSFMLPGDGISAHPSPAQCDRNNQPAQLSSQTHLTQPPASAIFPPNQVCSLTQKPAHQSPVLCPHHSSNSMNAPTTPTTSSAKLSGRQRASRSSKNRPSPLMRPVDKAVESREDRTNSAKRARSLTGASISMSPSFPGGLAKMGLADSPSPIDMQCGELNSASTSSSSIVDNNPATNPAGHTHALAAMPPRHGLSSMSSSTPNGWRLQPMTPASLFNFDSSLVVEASLGDHLSSNVQSVDNNTSCRKLNSVQETNEGAEASGRTASELASDKEGARNDPSSLTDKCLQVEQTNKSAVSNRSDSKEKASANGSNSGRSKSKDKNVKGRKNAGQKVRLDSMVIVGNEEEGPEYRKSSHKVAEQRRRDSLKMCFEDLRHILPPIAWNEKEEGQGNERRPGEGNVGGQRSVNAFDPLNPNKGISKVALLRRSNEYILRLKERLQRRDEAIDKLVNVLADHQRGLLFNHPDHSANPHAPEDAVTHANRPGITPAHPSADHPVQALLEDNNHTHQEIWAELRTILGQIRMEKQEDKDDHRDLSHTHRSRGSFSGEELD
ncbi:hypothetical protein PCASD_02551 [Puccinia coronata f. sp. avenae]|uniref:BHLH domain-containing protein n=1 Tax=Puccinia coronata f. sp. avenae TaxID=200324 RepID=A0A2N5VBH3_9BASI|nr:hypothetical protein PCASD_02551 [Puccinia coronata f. sp. avenae]